MAYNNNIMFIRYQLLARLVKMWKENELLEKVDRLPVELHPRKQKPLGRCCVYKERAVTKYKTMAMMGFDMTDETDETERIVTKLFFFAFPLPYQYCTAIFKATSTATEPESA